MQRPTIHDRLTPSKNVHHITADLPSVEVYTRTGKKTTATRRDVMEMARLRARLEVLQNVDYTPLESPVSTWDELQERGIDVFENHANALSDESTGAGVGARTAVRHAGTAGAGVIGAFLRTVPELVAPKDRASAAKDSVRTIMTWAAFSADADQGLTYLICNPRPNLKLDDRTLYTGLTFDPDYFKVVEPQFVELDYDKLQELPKEDTKKIDRHIQGNDVFYGCPFRVQLPKFYKAMTTTAIRSGLL